MQFKIKDIGASLLGIGVIICLILLTGLFLKGGLWLSETLYPYLYNISFITFVICIVILVPLTIFKETRIASGIGFLIASYIFGTTAWIMSFLLVFILWGFIGLFIGLFMAGIGVVPLAMLATVFSGEWGIFGQLVLLIVFTFGFRILAIYLSEETEQETITENLALSYEQNVEEAFQEAETLYNNEEYKDAITAYNNAIELYPTSDLSKIIRNIIFSYSKLLDLEFDENDHPKSEIQILKSAIKQDPNSAFLYNYLGRGYYYWESYVKNAYAKAIKMFDKSIELEPNFASPWFNKGEAFWIQSKYDEALNMFDKAIKLNPGFTDAYFTKGLLLEEKGEYTEALKMIEIAIELKPYDTQFHNTKSDLLKKIEMRTREIPE